MEMGPVGFEPTTKGFAIRRLLPHFFGLVVIKGKQRSSLDDPEYRACRPKEE